jgi:hypothetical protein
VHSITNYSNITPRSEFIIDDSRESMNRILAQMNLSPIKSQTRKKLNKCSDSKLRYITSKIASTVRVIAGIF